LPAASQRLEAERMAALQRQREDEAAARAERYRGLSPEQERRLVVIEDVNSHDVNRNAYTKLDRLVSIFADVNGFNPNSPANQESKTQALVKLNEAFRNKLRHVLDNLRNQDVVPDERLNSLSTNLSGEIAGLDDASMALKTEALEQIRLEQRFRVVRGERLATLSGYEQQINNFRGSQEELEILRDHRILGVHAAGDPVIIDRVIELYDRINTPQMKPNNLAGVSATDIAGKFGQDMYAELRNKQNVFLYNPDDLLKPTQQQVLEAIRACYTDGQSAVLPTNRYLLKILILIANEEGTRSVATRGSVTRLVGNNHADEICPFINEFALEMILLVTGCRRE
jgi:hypothetical protein